MPSPIAHAVSGYAIAQLFALKSETKQFNPLSGSLALHGVGMAIAADLDFIPQFMTGVKFHHGLTHSLLFAVGVAVGAFCFRRVWPPSWPKSIFYLTLALYGSHLLLDFFTDGGNGIQLFWPFNLSYWRSPIPLFPSTHWSQPLFYPGHFLFLVYELGYSFCIWMGLRILRNHHRQGKWQRF
jgi:inner membrane protein